jgi:hypothetical protein
MKTRVFGPPFHTFRLCKKQKKAHETTKSVKKHEKKKHADDRVVAARFFFFQKQESQCKKIVGVQIRNNVHLAAERRKERNNKRTQQ